MKKIAVVSAALGAALLAGCFSANVPRDVMQSNWYYSGDFAPSSEEYRTVFSPSLAA